MKGQVYRLRALLSQLSSQIVYIFNDWTTLIKDNLIQLTKQGKLWRCGKNAYRLDWEKAIGKVFNIHGKGCLLLNHFKKDDEWYLTYFDGENIITETQNAAKYRKNVSKKAIIEKPQDKIVVPTIKHQLCLPAPKELIDRLVEEANKIAHIKNVETWEDIEEEIKEDIQDGCIITDLDIFRDKTRFAYKHLNVKRVYRELVKKYHPDKTKTNEEYFEIVNGLYNIYK